MTSTERDASIRASRYLKRALFITCHYPAFSKQFISEQIERPDTDPVELHDYRANCVTANRRLSLVLVLIYILYGFKNLYFVHETMRLYDYDNYEQNIRPIVVGPYGGANNEELANSTSTDMNYSLLPAQLHTLKSVSCLITNCTRLGPLVEDFSLIYIHSQLADEVSRLPLFRMCHPRMNRTYGAAGSLDSFGILAFVMDAYTVLLLGAWPIVQQKLAPASNELIMFVTSPKITGDIVRRRTRELMRDLRISYQNYCTQFSWKDTSNRLTGVNSNSFKFFAQLEQSPSQLVGTTSRHKKQRAAVGGSQGRGCSLLILPDDMDESRLVRVLYFSRDTCKLQQAHYMSPNGLMASTCSLTVSSVDSAPTAAQSSIPSSSSSSGGTTNDTRMLNSDQDLIVKSLAKSLSASLNDQLGGTGAGADGGCDPNCVSEQVIDNCMPLVRLVWWRPKLAVIFIKTMIFTCVAISMISFFSFAYIHLRVIEKRQLLKAYDHEMAHMNCYLWSATGGGGVGSTKPNLMLDPKQAIRLGQMDISYTTYSFLETFLLNYLPSISIAFLFTYFWVIITDFSVWLAELRMFILASVLATRLKYCCPQDPNDTTTTAPVAANQAAARHRSLSARSINTRDFYRVENLRQQFRESVVLVLSLVFKRWLTSDEAIDQQRRGSNSSASRGRFTYSRLFSEESDRFHERQFMQQILTPTRAISQAEDQQQQPLDYDVETLEQIYINFRLLIESVHKSGPSMTVVVAIIYLLNYGYVLLGVYCQLKFVTLANEPACIIVVGFFIANYLIYQCANFHANAKKLQPLLWSLIAQLTHARSLREQHLRFLWLNQAVKLDNEAGLAFKALGMRITYVYIIELTIWTATIFALALKPHGE